MNKTNRNFRLNIEVSADERRAIEDLWFRESLPSMAAAIRELLRRGLAREREEESN